MNDSFEDKRECKRHKVTDFVVAVYADRLGRLIDISESGFSMQMLCSESATLPEEGTTSFLTKEKGFLAEKLPLKQVRKEDAPFAAVDSVMLHTVGAKFDISNPSQQFKVKRVISKLTASE
jgi:hypothetical protein